MGAPSTPSLRRLARSTQRATGSWISAVVLAVVLAAAAIAVTAGQVEVRTSTADAARSCGSVFDGLADRSGWEVWWAADLDDPRDEVRSALLRTTECPAAINRRMALAAGLGAAAAILAVVAHACLGRPPRRPAPDDDAASRLARLGRGATSGAGAALTIAGVAAVVLLVADADSTLFLYTDRLVVAVVGLIVLVPTVALFVLGRTRLVIRLARTGPWSDRSAARPVDRRREHSLCPTGRRPTERFRRRCADTQRPDEPRLPRWTSPPCAISMAATTGGVPHPARSCPQCGRARRRVRVRSAHGDHRSAAPVRGDRRPPRSGS